MTALKIPSVKIPTTREEGIALLRRGFCHKVASSEGCQEIMCSDCIFNVYEDTTKEFEGWLKEQELL